LYNCWGERADNELGEKKEEGTGVKRKIKLGRRKLRKKAVWIVLKGGGVGNIIGIWEEKGESSRGTLVTSA